MMNGRFLLKSDPTCPAFVQTAPMWSMHPRASGMVQRHRSVPKYFDAFCARNRHRCAVTDAPRWVPTSKICVASLNVQKTDGLFLECKEGRMVQIQAKRTVGENPALVAMRSLWALGTRWFIRCAGYWFRLFVSIRRLLFLARLSVLSSEAVSGSLSMAAAIPMLPATVANGMGASAMGAAVAATRGIPFVGPALEAFGLVFFSEFGDKSMFTTALLSMRYGTQRMRGIVLMGAMAALTSMTFISCFLGRLMKFLPARVTLLLSVALLTLFGSRFLQQAFVSWREHRRRQAHAVENGESGDASEEQQKAKEDLAKYQISLDDTPVAVFVKSFTIIALAEWCDRSMFATMALAANATAFPVIFGATAANLLCTGMAVAGGSLFNKLPERIVHFFAGVLFLATAAYTYVVELPETE